jgi:uncharacterized membrane protein
MHKITNFDEVIRKIFEKFSEETIFCIIISQAISYASLKKVELCL